MTRARLTQALLDLAEDYEGEREYNEALKLTADMLRSEAQSVEQSAMSDEAANEAVEKLIAKYRLY